MSLPIHLFSEFTLHSSKMSENKEQTETTEQPKISRDERNLVVSFIQFLRQKVSANECSADQIEAIEGKSFIKI